MSRSGGWRPDRPGADARPVLDYRRLARRHRRALALALTAGLMAAGVQLWLTRQSYQATAAVTLGDPAALATRYGDELGPVLSIDSEVQLLRSAQVAGAAERQLRAAGHRVDAARVTQQFTITVPAGTRELRIKYRADTAAGARAGADAVGNGFLAVRTELLENSRRQWLTRIETYRRTAADALALERARARDTRLPRQARVAAADRAEALTSQVSRLQARGQAVQDLDARPGLLQPAARANGPRMRNRAVPVASGLALGVLGWALLLPVLGRVRRVHRSRDALDLPGVRSAGTRSTGTRSTVVAPPGSRGPSVTAVLPADVETAEAGTARRAALGLAGDTAGHGPTALVTLGTPGWALLQALELELDGAPAGRPRSVIPEQQRPTERLYGTSPTGVCLAALNPAGGATVDHAVRAGLIRLSRQFPHLVVLAPAPGRAGHRAMAAAADDAVVVARRGRTRLLDLAAAVGAARAAGSPPVRVVIDAAPVTTNSAGPSPSRKEPR